MNCANCLKPDQTLGAPRHSLKGLWLGFARTWRIAVAKLGQLG